MFDEIKSKIDKNLAEFVKQFNSSYSINKISSLLGKNIKEFILRKGKRIRPVLFVIGYRGFSDKNPSDLYTSALSIEILHDFMLIHDDIVDKSDTRRGKPSLHKLLDKYLSRHKNIKFTGSDLSLIAGDVIYSMAIAAFLSIKEDPLRKEKALKNFIKAAVFTGSGQFLEILTGIKPIEKITRADIFKIYDYKTAHYTFVTPLTTGAILAGAPQDEIAKLFQFGIFTGRAFQIKDDILGMFGNEKKIGKSILSDLQEAKKTILIWHAYNNCGKKDKSVIKKILTKNKVTIKDLVIMQKVITKSGALSYVKKEISLLTNKAKKAVMSCSMDKSYKDALTSYCEHILK